MQINNLCSNIIMVFRLDFKVFQALQKATLTDCLATCIKSVFYVEVMMTISKSELSLFVPLAYKP